MESGEHSSNPPPQPAAALLPLVYEELRRIAAGRLANENVGQTLQPTALVHEVYVRLVRSRRTYADQGHFLAVAAEAMRRILIENARRKKRLKRGGGVLKRSDLAEAELAAEERSENLLALDEALTRLSAIDPVRAEVVKLRFFGGLTMPEIASTLELSLSTVERYWVIARAWLMVDLADARKILPSEENSLPR